MSYNPSEGKRVAGPSLGLTWSSTQGLSYGPCQSPCLGFAFLAFTRRIGNSSVVNQGLFNKCPEALRERKAVYMYTGMGRLHVIETFLGVLRRKHGRCARGSFELRSAVALGGSVSQSGCQKWGQLAFAPMGHQDPRTLSPTPLVDLVHPWSQGPRQANCRYPGPSAIISRLRYPFIRTARGQLMLSTNSAHSAVSPAATIRWPFVYL